MRAPRERPRLSRFRDAIAGPHRPSGGAEQEPWLSSWAATTANAYEPPEGIEPYEPDGDTSIPWELRD